MGRCSYHMSASLEKRRAIEERPDNFRLARTENRVNRPLLRLLPESMSLPTDGSPQCGQANGHPSVCQLFSSHFERRCATCAIYLPLLWAQLPVESLARCLVFILFVVGPPSQPLPLKT